MNKEKIKHLPFNLVFNISSFLIPFSILNLLGQIENWIAVLISLYIYLKDAIQSSNNDYLEERIKKLENNGI